MIDDLLLYLFNNSPLLSMLLEFMTFWWYHGNIKFQFYAFPRLSRYYAKMFACRQTFPFSTMKRNFNWELRVPKTTIIECRKIKIILIISFNAYLMLIFVLSAEATSIGLPHSLGGGLYERLMTGETGDENFSHESILKWKFLTLK